VAHATLASRSRARQMQRPFSRFVRVQNVTLVGRNIGGYGAGAAALIFVGGRLCEFTSRTDLNSSLSSITCLLPPGVQLQRVTVLQSGSTPIEQNVSIMYTGCPAGYAGASIDCLPCLSGYYAGAGSTTCL
jgi:hypothetical protein